MFLLCQRVPYPPDRGDKISTFHLLRHMTRTHEVHVLCLADGVADLGNVSGLDGLAASVNAVPVSAWRSRWRALRALISDRPLSVSMLDEPALHAAMREAVARLQPDVLFVHSSTVAQYAEPFDGLTRIIHFADLDSQKWLGLSRRTLPPMRWIYALEARRLLRYEGTLARRFSRSFVCTEQEAEDFRRLLPGQTVGVLRNGIDLGFFRSNSTPRQPGALVFTGVMSYLPNVDAMVWFCEAILPLVRADLPGVTLTICGSAPSRKVRRLARVPGVMVTGRVPDVRPYLDRASLFVAPLRLGRGIPNKLLEAMAMGLPVITTEASMRATGIAPGAGIVAADTPAAFAAIVVALLQDDAERARMERAARRVLEAGLDWDSVLASSGDFLASPQPPPRQPDGAPCASCSTIASRRATASRSTWRSWWRRSGARATRRS